MKVALVYPGYPPEEELGGGISTYVSELSKSLSQFGHDVTIISRTASFKEVVEYKKGITVVRLPEQSQLARFITPLVFRYWGAYFYSRRVRILIEKLEREKGKFDVIECGDWGGEAFCLIDKYKENLVIRLHTPSFVSEKYNPLNPPYLSLHIKSMEKSVIKKAKYLATPSRSLIKEIEKYITITDNIEIQDYPLQIEGFPSKKRYKSRFTKQSPLRILVAGRLEQRKGQDIVCEALNRLAEKLPFIRIDFAGPDTPLNKEEGFKDVLFSNLSPKSRTQVCFLGHVPHLKMPSLYVNYDLFLLSSRFESLGFAVLEAMRAGVPVLAADMCEMPRIIKENKNGYLFSSGSPNSLAHRLINLVESPLNLKRVGLAGRHFIKLSYGHNRPVKKTIEFYKQILEQKQHVS